MVDYKWYRYTSVSVYKFEGIEADSIDEAKDFVIEEIVSKMGKQPTVMSNMDIVCEKQGFRTTCLVAIYENELSSP